MNVQHAICYHVLRVFTKLSQNCKRSFRRISAQEIDISTADSQSSIETTSGNGGTCSKPHSELPAADVFEKKSASSNEDSEAESDEEDVRGLVRVRLTRRRLRTRTGLFDRQALPNNGLACPFTESKPDISQCRPGVGFNAVGKLK